MARDSNSHQPVGIQLGLPPLSVAVTWDRTKYGSTACSATTVCPTHGTTASLMTTSEVILRLMESKRHKLNHCINFEYGVSCKVIAK